MTISNASRTAGPFIGNGVTTDFPFAYKVFNRADLLVARTVTATGVETILAIDADYTVVLNSDQNTAPGGIIRMLSPLAVGSTLAATSNLSIIQPLDLTNGGGFYPKVINDALDRIVINIQQLSAKIGLGALNIGTAATIAAVLNALANLAGSAGAGSIGFIQSGIGAIIRSVRAKLLERPTFEDFGADGTGGNDSSAAFLKAITSRSSVQGVPGSIYLLSSTVAIALANRKLYGNGSLLRGTGATMLYLTSNNCVVDGFQFDANGALYTVHNDGGTENTICNNSFYGTVGHYIFDRNGVGTAAHGNRVDGREIDRIGTSMVFEGSKHFSASNNHFKNGENWCIQTRGASHGTINGNTCFGSEYLASVTAAAAQTVFNFVLSAPCHLAGLQVDGLPVDSGITFLPTVPAATPTKNWQVTFATAPGAGKVVKLIAFRSAENIQINNASTDITVTGNACTGSGDSGIIVAGGSSVVTVTGNTVQNISYTGISIEGGSEGCVVTGNIVRDCSKVSNAATYSSGILVGGNNNYVGGNGIINTAVPNPQRYGVSVNTYGSSVGAIDVALKIGPNLYFSTSQPFVRDIYIPNEDANQRRQGIAIADGVRTDYPAQVDLDSAWTNNPVSTPYFSYSGFGATFAIRDTAVKQGGVASLKTVANEYVEIVPLAASIFLNTIVDITFWAKNDNGSSFVQTFLDVGGVFFNSPSATITSTSWKQYRLSFPVTANINLANFRIRIGSNSGFANIQHLKIAMTAIP